MTLSSVEAGNKAQVPKAVSGEPFCMVRTTFKLYNRQVREQELVDVALADDALHPVPARQSRKWLWDLWGHPLKVGCGVTADHGTGARMPAQHGRQCSTTEQHWR
jgi:hypothetical protein